jgi:hypothetical protein
MLGFGLIAKTSNTCKQVLFSAVKALAVFLPLVPHQSVLNFVSHSSEKKIVFVTPSSGFKYFVRLTFQSPKR